jgi:hypothetical protein
MSNIPHVSNLNIYNYVKLILFSSDCTAPFQVTVVTDALSDAGTAAGPNTAASRGL